MNFVRYTRSVNSSLRRNDDKLLAKKTKENQSNGQTSSPLRQLRCHLPRKRWRKKVKLVSSPACGGGALPKTLAGWWGDIRSFGSKFLAPCILLLSACTTFPDTPPPTYSLARDKSSNFAELALACVTREYPNKISHVLQSDADARTPKDLHPAFYGCFDWHSSVHGHWLLVRLLRDAPDAAFAKAAIAALDANLTSENILREIEYLTATGRASFERPYGLAWILQLATELREWDDPKAKKWLQALAPLEAASAQRFTKWTAQLAYPIRTGTHHSSAFAFALALDWARTAADEPLEQEIYLASLQFYARDENCPIGFEPSGEDFLSPCLMEADLMRRVLTEEQFSIWLSRALPGIPKTGRSNWLEPARIGDITDSKSVHLEGLNLSRAWNLEMIALALPKTDRRRNSLFAAALAHRQATALSQTGQDYSGGHWLGSFATYLATGRGVSNKAHVAK
ncbi:FIG00721233: hypothetical protein [hydrothermal vent metagenome]|uniref:DUF2891 domain-containing protein n=1 Tax=hydrothermal vent metagenome TaxID=652676 RepID=A0A3B0RWP4_9ZZZZ